MKKIFILLAILSLCVSLYACDICGCSSGSYFIGPYPHFQKRFVGVRYSFRNYFSRMADDPAEFSKDLYQTAELWGGINLGKRWQVMAFLPYNINRQQMEHHPHKEHGVGDISMFTNYQLLSKNNNQLWIGGGLKLPTGKFDPGFANHPVPSANVQPGSGSVDYLLTVTDIVTIGGWSLYTNVNHKMNGTKKEFHFGNRLNVAALLSHSWSDNGVFNPYAGFQYEHLGGNKYQRAKIEDTGGQALLGTAGFDLQMGKLNIGMNMQLPLAQNFSHHQTDANARGMVQVMYLF